MNIKTKLFILAMAVSATGLLTCSGPSAPDLAEPEYNNPYDERGNAYIPTPDLNTVPVTGIRALEAVSGGQFETDYGKPVTAKGVCWSTEEEPTVEDNCTNDGQGHGAFVSVMTGLQHDQVYYVRAYATNEDSTGYGGQLSLTTRDGIPVLATIEPFDVKAFSAKTGGDITDDGGADVAGRGLCWAVNENPTLNHACEQSGNGTGSFEVELSDLQPHQTYYVRAYGTTGMATSYGAQQSFTTTDGLAIVTTAAPWQIRAYSALAGGQVTDQDDAAITDRGVCYSTEDLPTIGDSCIATGEGEGAFEVLIDELDPDRVYYVRAYAVNQAGMAYGGQEAFTTRDGLPVLTTTYPFDIRLTSAKTGGDITDDGGSEITNRGVCYSAVNINPTTQDGCVSSGRGTGSFEVI